MTHSGRIRDVLLIRPVSRAFSCFPPLNLMMLAAYLSREGFSVRVLDLYHPADAAELEAMTAASLPVVFGVTATTPEFPDAVCLIHRLKCRFPSVPIVLGGVHMSALGVDALIESGADFGVVGEGEAVLAGLVSRLAAGDGRVHGIPGLVFREGGRGVANAPAPVFADVDSLPPADWESVSAERYFANPWGILQERPRTGFIVTSRGCPCSCPSCASGFVTGAAFRGRHPELVVDEIETLHRRYGVGEILVAEDNFTLDRDRAFAICEGILARGLDIAWRTPNGISPDTLDVELARLMKKSGCYLTGFSTECPGNFDRFDILAEKIAVCRESGMRTFCSFILGRPDETLDSARTMIRFAMRSRVDIAHFGVWAPYPGSPEFERFKDVPGMREWGRYLLFDALPVSGLPPRRIKSLMRYAYLSFYLRPARARLYAGMMKPAQIAWALKAFLTYLR